MALPKRIIKETERLMSDAPPGISAEPHEDNLRHFQVVVDGPEGSPYEGGKFKLELFLPDECTRRFKLRRRSQIPWRRRVYAF